MREDNVRTATLHNVDLNEKVELQKEDVHNVHQEEDFDKEEDAILRKMGYEHTLPRSMSYIDNLLTSVGALYFLGGVQTLFGTALASGGSAPTWSNWVICTFFTLAIAASLAEVCSLYPTAGSIYFWVFKMGGKNGPVLSWIACYLCIAAWCMNVASDSFAAANFLLSEPTVFGYSSFSTDSNDFTFRACQFGVSLAILLISTGINLLPPKFINYGLRITAILMAVLYLANMIWLPIGAYKNYGLNNASDVFTQIDNSNGASTSYNWFINILFPMYSLIGFDASGHVSEETKGAHVAAARGIFNSALYSGVLAFPLVIVLLFCNPANTSSTTYAQPIVSVYLEATGVGGQTFFVVIAVFLSLMNAAITLLSTSRLAFAIARDGIFHPSIANVNKHGQPSGAIWIITLITAILLITVLPSAVAYNSMTSGSVISLLATYFLVIFSRLFLSTTPSFPSSYSEARIPAWNLGRWSYAISFVAAVWSFICIIVLSLPQEYPITYENMNYAPFMFLVVVAFSLLTWFLRGQHWFGKNEDTLALNLPSTTKPKKIVKENDLLINKVISRGGGEIDLDSSSERRQDD